jgi:hypothetical protein
LFARPTALLDKPTTLFLNHHTRNPSPKIITILLQKLQDKSRSIIVVVRTSLEKIQLELAEQLDFHILNKPQYLKAPELQQWVQ